MRKVIFLDIDGVLNDSKGDIVEEERILRLKRIIDATGAQIILSSSWRLFYKYYLSEGFIDTTVTAICEGLKRHDIAIADITPDCGFGRLSRPLEVRLWLRNNDVENYVILDDSDWDWRSLQPFVVRTITGNSDDYTSGLEDTHVEKAIAILNGGHHGNCD